MLKLHPIKVIDFEPVIVAKDKNEHPVLMIDLRFSPLYSATDLKLEKMEEYQNVPFLMFVNSQIIKIFKTADFKEVATLPTQEVLLYYNPEIADKMLFQSSLITLIQAWLRDLAYHWKSQEPPFVKEIKEIDLFDYLIDGSTQQLED
ncbi:hypothetical protein [Anabaena sp. CCY 0017]|uniref:hypothetical protein n=1 Tax=Anabaena sp. CCY 0017 TaxID=3103866 RepID=UPI0039C73E96